MLTVSCRDAIKECFSLSHVKSGNWCFYHTVGLNLQVHPGSVSQQKGGDKIMALRKFKLSISLLAASLMLAAPAQAETWSCAYYDKSAKHPRPIAFARDGGRFKNKILAEFVIVYESDQAIHLYAQKTETTASIVVLNKQRKTFIMAWTNNPNKGEPTVTQWVGGCIIL